MTSSFANHYIQFHTAENANAYENLCRQLPDDALTDQQFGVLSFQANKVSAESRNIIILFTLDVSSSMSECSSSHKDKIGHLKHTMKNILKKISATENVNVQICIITFSDDAQIFLETTQITKENVDEIIAKVMNLEADGTTNLEKAFRLANQEISKYNLVSGNNKIVHINMTDGEITAGEGDAEKVKTALVTNIDNVLIGFGNDHDTFMLKTLSGIKNGEYWFIDNIENTGMVYGEVIHHILYTATEEVYLSVNNGKIYDWENNMWTDYLYIGNVYSEQERHFQVISDNPLEMRVHIFYADIVPQMESGTIPDNYVFGRFMNYDICEPLPPLLDSNNIPMTSDQTHFMFRQKTQQLLGELREHYRRVYANNKHTDLFRKIFQKYTDSEDNTLGEIKKKMQLMIQLIMETISVYEQSSERDMECKMLKLLCDDLYVSCKTIGTQHGPMYSYARETSQGHQNTYSVGAPDITLNEETYSPYPDVLTRQFTDTQIYDDWEGVVYTDSEIKNSESDISTVLQSYCMMPTLGTPFSTQQVRDFMEEMNE